ncbi:hypothetical protein RHMOL_Rhmol07G0085800 [Rhododendron molle]|uniref:Uncharacterized protein n=1 Tax=Rhododendron molle TaxID=49168 RepID=A0ACC0MYI3_RHOML|nr:hypothetical protein RHMOL_Rhmol07G0085800 [Rhododendron molle]
MLLGVRCFVILSAFGLVWCLLAVIDNVRFFWCSLQRLPHGLHQYFDANGSSTWVLPRRGMKAWPLEIVNHQFREGWDSFREAHELQVDYKLIQRCEHKWIFYTIIYLIEMVGNLCFLGRVQIHTGKICIFVWVSTLISYDNGHSRVVYKPLASS